MTEIERLDKEINEQREENIRLYSIFQYRCHEEEMQPLIKEWRDGSNHLKQLISRRNMFIQSKETSFASGKKSFVNGYGEATKREITSSTYARAEKRLSKQIMNFVS